MKKALAFLALFLFVGFGFSPASAVTTINSDVTIDSTWDLAGSPYEITKSDFLVANGATLTIEPGVTVKVGASITSKGRIIAVGTSSSRITFTKFDANPAWYGFSFAREGGDCSAHDNQIHYADLLNITGSIGTTGQNVSLDHILMSVTNASSALITAYGNTITCFGPSLSLSITNSQFTFNTSNAGSTVVFLRDDGIPATISGNAITATFTGANTTLYGIILDRSNTTSYAATVANNTVNLTASHAGVETVYGIYQAIGVSGPVSGNNVTITAPRSITGIMHRGGALLSGNTIALSTNNSGGYGYLYGLYSTDTTATSGDTVVENKIGLSSSHDDRLLYGIYFQSGKVRNNRILISHTGTTGAARGAHHPYYPHLFENNSIKLTAGEGIYVRGFTDEDNNSNNANTCKNNIFFGSNVTNSIGVEKIGDGGFAASNNLVYNFETALVGTTLGSGGLTVDPQFADAELTLSPGSPAIDAGGWDFSFVNEPSPNGGRIDMGAFGNTSSATSDAFITKPEITTQGGVDFTATSSPVTLAGRTSSLSTSIRVNGSTTGVTYTPGQTSWSYSGTLSQGVNAFSVTAIDGSGHLSTADTISVTFTNTAPTAPTLVYPTDGASGLLTSVNLKFNNSTDSQGDAITYKVFVCTNASFTGCTTPVATAAIDSASSNGGSRQSLILAVTLVIGVLALTLLSGLSPHPWMPAPQVLTTHAAWTPMLLVLSISLSACLGGSGGSSNDLPSTQPTPSPTPTPTPASDKSVTVNGLSPNTTYYWKVIATDTQGAETSSSVRSFTTQ